MTRIRLHRRSLVVAAAGGALAWLGKRSAPPADAAGGAHAAPDDDAIARLCSELRCPQSIGKACQMALPPLEASAASLKRAILMDIRREPRQETGRLALADAVRRRSQKDFLEGRIVRVNGWILSLTETRVYALATQLPTKGRRSG